MHIDEITAKLTDNGKSVTPARREIINMLVGTHQHVTADELYQQLRAAGSRVGRMTVFRTLDLLAEVGAVRPIYQGSGAAHFVLLEGGKHHHLVCNQCAKTVEFDNCTLTAELSQQLGMTHNFRIEGHLLELYGVCSDCQ